MIQRIQSVYLAILVIISLLLFFLPLYSLVPGETSADTATYSFSFLQVKMTTAQGLSQVFLVYYPLLVINALIGIVAIATLLLFKNRPQQMKICRLLFLFVLILIVLTAFDTSQLRTIVGPGNKLEFSFAAILPVLQLILCRLAGMAIKKDENLVRSADRLR